MARAGARVARSKRRYQLELTVQYGVENDGLPTAAQLRTWVKAALQCDADVTVRLVGPKKAARSTDSIVARITPPMY